MKRPSPEGYRPSGDGRSVNGCCAGGGHSVGQCRDRDFSVPLHGAMDVRLPASQGWNIGHSMRVHRFFDTRVSTSQHSCVYLPTLMLLPLYIPCPRRHKPI